MTVGLVLVSHSAKIAEGLAELAAQMAPSVALVPAGGTDDGGIGTSFDAVSAAIAAADSGDGAVILCDLGSAVLTAETALDLLDDDARARVLLVDAPLVEGAVAAAVAAEGGGDVAAVAAAGESARGARTPDAQNPQEVHTAQGVAADAAPAEVVERLALTNRQGLHARPAAEFVRTAAGFDAQVTVNGVDAKSLLRIMALGLVQGAEVELRGTGPDAGAAVAALAGLVRSGFGEESG
ncbi:MAG: sugar transporter subunit [Naasia sp.]|nr:sugar transporter subunit [Naasia sp.]